MGQSTHSLIAGLRDARAVFCCPWYNEAMKMNKKVVVGLSGGVDSSVAALLLKLAGFDILGVYLKCYWTYVGCRSDEDRASAARVAAALNIPFEVWDFEKEYRQKVVEYFYSEYGKGRTPNPDIVCNREIKFGLFFQEAVKNRGFDFIATGHYAGTGIITQSAKEKGQGGTILPFNYQKSKNGDSSEAKVVLEPGYFELLNIKHENCHQFNTYYRGPVIFGGVAKNKDQSYFLYDIPQEAIDHSLYPLFLLTKTEVRAIASAHKLPTADRPDSQGICFIGEVSIEKFLKERVAEHPGEVVDKHGRVIGQHKGIEFYTIGQRHGFVIFNSQFSILNIHGPLYVIGKDVEKNRLVVGAGEECKADHFRVEMGRNDQFTISNFQTSTNVSVAKGQNLFVRIRHLGEMIPCEVREIGSDLGKDQSEFSTLLVKLAYPVFGVAPGQSAVFYRKFSIFNSQFSIEEAYEIVGGGVIADPLKAGSDQFSITKSQ